MRHGHECWWEGGGGREGRIWLLLSIPRSMTGFVSYLGFACWLGGGGGRTTNRQGPDIDCSTLESEQKLSS